jgi:hypothetical protein
MKESTTRISAAVSEMHEAWTKYLTARDAYDTANHDENFAYDKAQVLDSWETYIIALEAYDTARDALCAKNSAYVAYLAAARVVRCLQNNKNQ